MSAKILALRQLLSDRGFSSALPAEDSGFTTGLEALDAHAISKTGITEVVASPEAGPGGVLLLYGLVHALRDRRLALIDAQDAFDPSSLLPADLEKLLWVCSVAGIGGGVPGDRGDRTAPREDDFDSRQRRARHACRRPRPCFL